MSRSIAVAVLWSALSWPAAGKAADARPAWLDRAERSVARIRVPPRPGVGERLGSGLAVGLRGGVLHVITAGHVIWPDGIPETSETVTVEVHLAALCALPLTGSASPERAVPKHLLDLAVVTISLDEASASERLRTECPDLPKRAGELPQQFIDPEAESLRGGAQAWLVGRSPEGGLEKLNVGLKAKVTEQIRLARLSDVRPGQSGSPLLSERGHLVGMIVTDDAESAAKSYRSILNQLVLWGDVPTELAGEYANLTFRQELRAPFIQVAGRPPEALTSPHPSPRGEVDLRLRVEGRPEVSGRVNVDAPAMVCKVSWVGKFEAWAVRHRRTTLGVTLGLAAVGVTAGLVAWDAKKSFDESPSEELYDRTQNANLAADIAYGTALATGAVWGYGFWNRNDKPGVSCVGERR